jgi:hypothetical protein
MWTCFILWKSFSVQASILDDMQAAPNVIKKKNATKKEKAK